MRILPFVRLLFPKEDTSYNPANCCMPVSSGERLGSYEILGSLGSGGMGEVYRGRDTRLGREVAIKILPNAFAGEPERIRLFERESKTLGALSHPNILAIFDVGIEGNTSFIVTELLHGRTLRQLLQKGALPRRNIVEYSTQIAAGLAAAHSQGVVHRDLKPENIFVTTDEQIKILDFGLAKRSSQSAPSGSTTIGTETLELVAGTASYMSPEAVRGGVIDCRSDMFSLGAILYEMLFGSIAFKKESMAETMNAVVNEDPARLAQPHLDIPAGWDFILRHCLEKTPERRFQSAADLGFAIRCFANLSAEPPRKSVPKFAPQFAAVTTLLGLVLAGALFASHMGRAPVPKFRQLIFGRGFISSARFTPDGQSVVYGATFGGRPRELYLTRLDGQSSRDMGLPPADVFGISDHGEMAVSLGRHNYNNWMATGTLGLAPLAGGAARALIGDICDADIFADGRALAIVRCGGPEVTLEYPIGKVLLRTTGWISSPRISPTGKEVAFLEHPLLGDDRGYVTVVNDAGQSKRLTDQWAGLDALSWPPAGNEIWFTASAHGEPQALHAVNLAGKQRVVFSTISDLSLRDIARNGNVLLLDERDSTEVALGYKDKGPAHILDLADENAGIHGISNDGKVAALVYSGTADDEDYKTLALREGMPEPVLLGEGDPTGISTTGRWILSILPSNPSSLVFYPTDQGESQTISIRPVQMVTGASSWCDDDSQVFFAGAEPSRAPRIYMLNRKSGAMRAISPEGSVDPIVSPDCKLVLARDASMDFSVYPVDGATPQPVKGLSNLDLPIQWDSSGTKLYMWDRTLPAKVYRVDWKTGKRELWLRITPAEVSGVLYGHVLISPEGRSYAYSFRRVLTNLFLAENLR